MSAGDYWIPAFAGNGPRLLRDPLPQGEGRLTRGSKDVSYTRIGIST